MVTFFVLHLGLHYYLRMLDHYQEQTSHKVDQAYHIHHHFQEANSI